MQVKKEKSVEMESSDPDLSSSPAASSSSSVEDSALSSASSSVIANLKQI